MNTPDDLMDINMFLPIMIPIVQSSKVGIQKYYRTSIDMKKQDRLQIMEQLLHNGHDIANRATSGLLYWKQRDQVTAISWMYARFNSKYLDQY